jgi:hypothetical protein
MPTHARTIALLFALALSACEGPVGPQGAQGTQGPRGLAGEGLDASPLGDVPVASDASGDAVTVPDADFVPGDAPDPRTYCQSCHPALDVSSLNLVGIHDATSRRYLPNCLHCHADVLHRVTRDARYPDIHRRMVPFTGTFRGSVRNEDCTFCHRTVEFGGDHSAANLRRQVAASSCAGCHANGRWDYYLP